MCGVAGIFSKRGQPDQTLVRRMTEILTHRGPIEDGYHFVAPVSMGMRRLSIVDIAGGHQPVFNEDRQIAVMLNGQIYNYVELMEELRARGHVFYTRSDTEVIAHLYEEMGEQCLTRMNGMFVIVLWDAHREQLFIARDRLGVKPLYYADTSTAFAYASELKALLACDWISRDVDPAAIEEFLALMYIRAPRTPFKSIAKLLPGHSIVVNANGVCAKRWWNLRDHCEPTTLSLAQASDRVRDLLSDSVRLRLRSDVPVGAFLSGGLDSSAVTAFAAQHLPHAVNTYAVGFAGAEFDELGYARTVADAFKTDHHQTTVTVDNALAHLPQLVWHLDEPHADSAMVPTYLVSQVAARDLRVILSGLGGDELFGGYERYFDGRPPVHLYRRLPESLRCGLLVPLAEQIGAGLGARARRHNLPVMERYLDMQTVFPASQRAALLRAGECAPVTFADEFATYPGRDAVNRLMFVDALTYLPDDTLHITDRMSMAVSLEVRTPFLDYRLVEFASSLPGVFKVEPLRMQWKICLKQAMAEILPHEILTRRKWGFGAPVGAWMRQGLAQSVRAIYNDAAIVRWGLLDAARTQAYLDTPLPSEGSLRAQRMWSLLILEIWARVFLEGNGTHPSFTLAELTQ